MTGTSKITMPILLQSTHQGLTMVINVFCGAADLWEATPTTGAVLFVQLDIQSMDTKTLASAAPVLMVIRGHQLTF